MSADMLSEVQDTVVSGIENNSSPALSIEVWCACNLECMQIHKGVVGEEIWANLASVHWY